MNFLRSFKYAFFGIIYCIKNERNMRIHTVAAMYVLVFARFFTFSRGEYAALILTIGGVISAEALNTAVECLADRITKEKDPLIKAAKDCSAGAVLILAALSVVSGIILFVKPEGFICMYSYYISHPLELGATAALIPLSLVYIIAGPVGIANAFRKKGKGRRNDK